MTDPSAANRLSSLVDGAAIDSESRLEAVHRGAVKIRARRRAIRASLIAAVPVIVIVAVVVSQRAEPIEPPGPRYGVMSASLGPDLVMIDPRTWDPRPLATLGLQPESPALAPGGQTVVFAASPGEGGPTQLWSLRSGGASVGSPVQLTTGAGNATHPSFSPDGASIAYVREQEGSTDVWVMRADGSGQHALTGDPASQDWHPAWSPDGRRIAFERADGARVTLMSMAADGTDVQTVTDIHGSPDGLSWSPDGAELAFSDGDDIWTVPATGGLPQRRSSGAGQDLLPAFAPDGSSIAFVRTGDGIRLAHVSDEQTTRLLIDYSGRIKGIVWGTG